jgi:hypothetical protein
MAIAECAEPWRAWTSSFQTSRKVQLNEHVTWTAGPQREWEPSNKQVLCVPGTGTCILQISPEDRTKGIIVPIL